MLPVLISRLAGSSHPLRRLWVWAAVLFALAAVSPMAWSQAPGDPQSPNTPEAPAVTDPGLPPAPDDASDPAQDSGRTRRSRPRSSDPELIQFGSPITIEAGQTRRSAVVIQSSATVNGRLEEDLVVVGGTARINGTVERNVINVGGGIRLGPDARIGGNAVGVLGGVHLGTNAKIDGNALGFGGNVTLAPGARVHGKIVDQQLPFPSLSWWGPEGFALPPWVETTLTQLALKGRPLSFRVGWVWWVAGGFLVLHVLLALGAPGAVQAVSQTLDQRGATAFLMGLLALPLGALLALLLLATGIGIIVIPFMGAAFLLAALVGKAGLLHHIGSVINRNRGAELRPAAAVLLGTLPVTAVYLIPFAGVFFWAVLSMWALGGAWLALLQRFRRESAAPAQRPPAPTGSPPPGTAETPLAASLMAVAVPEPEPAGPPPNPEPVPGAEGGAPSAPPAMSLGIHGGATDEARSGPPPLPHVLELPRIGLKQRLFATAIDWAILLIAMEWLSIQGARWRCLAVLIYFAAFWTWRQTTLGGIVLQLRVVRLDARPVDATTAVVRALGAFFGSLVLGLGYFWSGWDPERQGWHDKIAGTVVVKTPKPQPLV